MGEIVTRWFEPPALGEAPDLPPDQLNPRQARALRNYLTHHPGRIVPRGGIGGPAVTDGGSLVDTTNGGAMLVAATYDDSLTINYRAPSAGALVDYWRVPINRPTLAAELAQPSLGATSARSVNLKTGVVTDINNAAATSCSGPSICRVDDALYTATYGGASTAIPTGVAPMNNVRKANVTGSAAVLTNGPRFVQAVFSHYGRVWAAAARRPAGTDYDTSQVFYSIAGGTTAFTDVATDWQDPVTGDLNRISVGAGNDGDFVVGFGRAAGHLVIFKRNSIWIMYGTAPSNFTLRQLRTQSGCVDLRSIVTADEGVYFASQLGYELFDGNRFTLLTAPISDTWLALSNAGVASGSVNHAYIQASPLPNGYLYLSLGTDGTGANGVDGTARGWLLHRASGAWIDIRTAVASLGLGGLGFFNRFVMSRSHVVALGASRWAKADGITYGADSGVIGVQDRSAGAAGSFAVDLLWTTYVDNLAGGRWLTSTLQHITADYYHEYLAGLATDAVGTLSASDGSGAVIVPSLSLPGYVSSAPLRTRPMFDTNYESVRGDLSLSMSVNHGGDAALRTRRFAVYGLGVNYQRGRERHIA